MRAVFACLLFGCSFPPGIVGDGGMPDTPDGVTCESYASLFDTCVVGTTLVKSALTLTAGTWTYNTDDNTLTSPAGTTMALPHQIIGALDVVFVSSFTVETNAILRLTGPAMDRGFGLAAEGAVVIRGVIDLSDNGAGARDDTPCGALTGRQGQSNNGGGGGGGGGAFKGNGGSGSNGNSDGVNETNGGIGGVAAARPTTVLGGCDGGDGGDGNGDGGLGGDGGGALYIASATSIGIENNGVIDASGGGGSAGGGNGDAGGGGGSGGMIVLESVMVRIAGIVVANGGGGGEGNTNGNPGLPGQRNDLPAPGGSGGDPNGGNGAAGGAGASFDGASSTDVQSGGGGGGGGGVGFIALACAAPNTNGAVISPPFEPWP